MLFMSQSPFLLSVVGFDYDDFLIFREMIIEDIKAEETGLILGHPLVGPFDGLAPRDHPLIASLIRLVFHDCSGLNPKFVASGDSSDSSDSSDSNDHDDNDANIDLYICDGCIDLSNPDNKGLYEGAIEPIEYICQMFYDDGLSRADCWYV